MRNSQSSTSTIRTAFATSGRVITFPGFLRAYVEGSADSDAEVGDREVRLPVLAVGDALDTRAIDADGRSISPPARYSEALLVKALEELGAGRPSTYGNYARSCPAGSNYAR